MCAAYAHTIRWKNELKKKKKRINGLGTGIQKNQGESCRLPCVISG